MAGLITTNQVSEVTAREIEFTLLFQEGIKNLIKALGVVRMIPKAAGTVYKTYKVEGTLEDGNVGEGQVIPLSQYNLKAVPYKEAKLKKYRKGTTAEAILDVGYDTAVTKTTDKMLKQVQHTIREDLFVSLEDGKGTASGTKLQEALAQAWGQLQILFAEMDGDIQPIYFLNPLDIADYLGSAEITTQNVFGMTYVENFLGLGSVMTFPDIPKGHIFATAKGNIVGYYIPVNGADLGEAFQFTTDQTGLVGIHEKADYDNMTATDTVVDGIEFFAEYADGVVVATIGTATDIDNMTKAELLAYATENGISGVNSTMTKAAIYKVVKASGK